MSLLIFILGSSIKIKKDRKKMDEEDKTYSQTVLIHVFIQIMLPLKLEYMIARGTS